MGKLTAIAVARIVKVGRYGDGDGLWLQVSRWGTKSWALRYKLNGNARQMGLGSIRTFTLKEARERARLIRQQLADDIDPIDSRRSRRMQAKAEAAKQLTFKEAAEKYIAAHRAGWKSATHAKQWTTTLQTYAYPVVGDLSVAAIETPHVLKVLEPIWTNRTVTANRVRGRIEAVLDWAAARGHRGGDNPAEWKGHLDKLLPAKTKVRKVEHHGAMHYGDVPVFMAKLRDMESIPARALEFTILTAARTSETLGARWPEFDLAAKVWTIPAERMKGHKKHRVPLSDNVVDILTALPREEGNPHVFIGTNPGKGLSSTAMREIAWSTDSYTVHGFRSFFRDWARNQTKYPREVAEAALAHVVGNAVEAAYRRSDALEKRRKLMQAWARYCERPTSSGQIDRSSQISDK